MGLLGIGTSLSSQSMDFKDIVDRYQGLRSTRMRLNNEIVERLPICVLKEGAKKLGLFHGDMFVFDCEEETAVLMDYCIYNAYADGRNAVDQYLCDCPPDPDSDEMLCLQAMQRATYTIIVVLDVVPDVGCHVRNMFTEETRLLIDIGFSQSVQPCFVIATRLLDWGDYITTSGAALPFGVFDQDELESWQREMNEGEDDEDFDPAPLIRSFLENSASSYFRYEGVENQRRIDVGGGSGRISAKERRALEKRRTGKPENRRCHCRSGKMYKNCCGKR